MRPLLPLVVLLVACGAAPALAPEAEPEDAARTLAQRVAIIEKQGAALAVRLAEAEARILVLEDQVVKLGGSVDELDKRTAEADKLLADGIGRQGGHLVVVEDYALALADPSWVPGTRPATADELAKALFLVDGPTTSPQVDGAGTALFLRMRKRPEILYQAWDDAVSDYLGLASSDPKNPLGAVLDVLESEDQRLAAGVEAVGDALCLGYLDETTTPPTWVCEASPL